MGLALPPLILFPLLLLVPLLLSLFLFLLLSSPLTPGATEQPWVVNRLPNVFRGE